MATKHIFGLPVELILIFIFVAVFIALMLIMAPNVHGGFIGSLFDILGQVSKYFGGF